MAAETPGPITVLLRRAAAGDLHAESDLLQALYGELHRLARLHMRGERPGHTLQPTALVHEAYCRLMRGADGAWQDRQHFLNVASNVMRRVLVDYARRRATDKRGNGMFANELRDVGMALSHSPELILAVDAALAQLAAINARQARIVQMRFFAGLTEGEIAAVLGISSRTVKRDWNAAKAWLYERLER